MKQPKIRLNGFQGEWKTGTIENTASFKSGNSFDFHREFCHIYPCYGGNGIREYVDKYSHNGCFPINHSPDPAFGEAEANQVCVLRKYVCINTLQRSL